MSIITDLTNLLTAISTKVPIPGFVFIGALVEEIIAPIPSPLIMTAAGSLAGAAGKSVVYLGLLAVIGAVAKTLGSWVIYIIGDKLEDVLLGKFGRLLGVSHKEVERMGSFLSRGKRDGVVMFFLRAIPIVPTAPVSLAAGLIKLRLRTYLTATLLGTAVRNVLYLYVGYAGLTTLEALNENLEAWETWGYIGLFVLVCGVIIWFYKNRSKVNKQIGIEE